MDLSLSRMLKAEHLKKKRSLRCIKRTETVDETYGSKDINNSQFHQQGLEDSQL